MVTKTFNGEVLEVIDPIETLVIGDYIDDCTSFRWFGNSIFIQYESNQLKVPSNTILNSRYNYTVLR